jgi:glycerol-3-phosphate O-acyltransferase
MTQIFEHIIPRVDDWPVAKLSRERSEFIQRLNKFVFNQLMDTHHENIHDLLSKTIYLENQRVKLVPWKVDPSDEKSYWKSIGIELEATLKREDGREADIEILKRIINRYNEEIVGSFKPKTFLFTRHFLTSFFKRIFGRYFAKGKWRWGKKSDLQEKIKIKGDIAHIRGLFEKGTVVVLPTHYSNLDSIMVGYAIDANVGLPSFSYGAGLNLYNVEIIAYFMNRLGAFRVDRRKKNPIYLECLKSMTGYSIIEGVNCIFFPGGTRSRNGQTEDKLKLGLIGSVIEAQRIHLEKKEDDKIYIVPLNIGYHFVLEASQLADQSLQGIGTDKYIRSRNSGPSFGSIIRFIKDIYTKESEVYMSFGSPMDVFGNRVDKVGNSFDKFGNPVALSDYFTLEGKLSGNSQRESVYAKIMAESVVDSYKKHNIILSSNIVSYVAFHMIFQEFKELGLIQLVNQRNKKYSINLEEFTANVEKLLDIVKAQKSLDEISLSDENWDDTNEIIKTGIDKLGLYHPVRVLKLEKDQELICNDIKLLYFYHNRMLNYNFEVQMGWQKV